MPLIHEEQPQEVQANSSDKSIRSAAREAVQLAKKHGLGVAYPIMFMGAMGIPVNFGANCWGGV